MKDSNKLSLNKADLLKILKGASIAGSAAVLTYLLNILPQFEAGQLSIAIMAVFSIIINAVLKYLAGKK